MNEAMIRVSPKATYPEAGEMTQLIKLLSYKHKDLSSDPQESN